MAVVLWMDKCPFCNTGHWTDQECEGDEKWNKQNYKEKIKHGKNAKRLETLHGKNTIRNVKRLMKNERNKHFGIMEKRMG